MKLVLRVFQVFCGIAVAGGLCLMLLLGSPLNAFVAGVDLFVHFLFMICCFTISFFGILGIHWASRTLSQDLLPSKIFKEFSRYAVLPVASFVLIWTIWAIAEPISIVRFSSGERRGGWTSVYFIDKFEGYRFRLATYESTIYKNGDYDEVIAQGIDRHLEIRHEASGAIYLQTLKIGNRWIRGAELPKYQEYGELQRALQKGRDRFELVTKKNIKPWF